MGRKPRMKWKMFSFFFFFQFFKGISNRF
jgi:hypothetical protein